MKKCLYCYVYPEVNKETRIFQHLTLTLCYTLRLTDSLFRLSIHHGAGQRKEVLGVWQDIQVLPQDPPPVQQKREGIGLRILLLQNIVISGTAEVQAHQHRVAVAKSEIEDFRGKKIIDS